MSQLEWQRIHPDAIGSHTKCRIDGCNESVHCKDLCEKHYTRLRRHGDPLVTMHGRGAITAGGYRQFSVGAKRKELEHIRVAQRALGRQLPRGAQVHHVNEIKTDNRGCNLVICPDAAYHSLLHQRTRAFDACGHADWLKCSYCGQYDKPLNLAPRASRGPRCHAACASEYGRKWRAAHA